MTLNTVLKVIIVAHAATV